VLAWTGSAARGYGTRVGQPAAAATAGGVHGFPAVLTSFIGRAEPAREVAGLLQQHRLVTVTGPGGVGKTRLAGQVARQVAGRFADGVWLVELAPVQDLGQVPGVVAARLGVQEQPGVPAAEAVARVLARQQLLLVLDNCEHVIGAAAVLCAGLLAACDDLRVLATSREPLRVAGEARYRLGPLALPAQDDLAEGAGVEAVRLFADRARQVDARFALDGQTGPAVARLVTRLDGMPLAIELAAARVEALGVAQLLDRLDDRFAMLSAGDRLAAGRHRSLAATVEWSCRLLDESGRRVFRAVSVFPGPFTLEAAEAVAGPGAAPAVLHLVDCSLLVPPRTGPDGRSRYAMLETLRAYGAGLLAEAGEAGGAAAALARWAVRVAEQAAAGLETAGGETTAARWLDAEDAMMRQVLAWGLDHDPGVALRLAVALGGWWQLRGQLGSQHRLLCAVAGQAAAGSEEWCVLQRWLGYVAQWSAELAVSLDIFTELRDAVAGRGPSRALAHGLAGRAGALCNMGRYAEAAEEDRRSLAVAQEVGYPVGEIGALVGLAFAAVDAGDYGSAVRLARRAGQITDGVPDWTARYCGYALTWVLIAAGELAAAEPVCAVALARSRDAGDVWTQVVLLPRMVLLDLEAGRLQDASAHLREVLQLVMGGGKGLGLYEALDLCGHLCAKSGRFAEAVTVWAAFAALKRHEEIPDEPPDARRREGPLRQARQALGPARTGAAEDRGAALSEAAAAGYALMLADPGPPQPVVPGAAGLSARERELVTLVAQGRTDAQIAAELYISVRTVRTHLDRIRDKTGCRRRADLTRLALQSGLV
jgi:predicted ATPase/DNA-binding CsgD family transcriptional regulator